MKFIAVFLMFCFAFLRNASGFLVAPAPSSVRVAPAVSMVAKKNGSSAVPPKREKPDPRTIKGLLQILITGSPDGISMIGKPQHNWVTGEKEYTASKGPKKFGGRTSK